MEFRGVFTPPAMGSRHRPIRLGGDGRIVLKDEGLEVHARKAEKYRSHIAVIFAVAVLAVAAIADTKLNLNVLDGEMLGIVFCVALFGSLAFMSRSKLGSEQVVLFPWASVKQVDVVEGELTILIKRNDPKGTLHFKPVGGADDAATAVRSRI